MAGHRFWVHCALAITVGVLAAQPARTQTGVPPIVYGPLQMAESYLPTRVQECKVYALADLGEDPTFGKWIAETIPQMIQPASWKSTDGKTKLSYYAPAKVLVINQTPAVHAQVDQFLQNLRKSLPQAKMARRDPLVVPAQLTVQDLQPPGPTPTKPSTSEGKKPKHLLHLVIGLGLRYEGEGIIDSNVVKFANALSGKAPGNSYSSDPMVRMEQMLIDSPNLRAMHAEWRKYWMNENPAQLAPSRSHGSAEPVLQKADNPQSVHQAKPARPAGPIPLMPMADPIPSPWRSPPAPLPPLNEP